MVMKLDTVPLLPHLPKNGDGVLEWIWAQRRTLENVLKKIKDDLDPAVGGDIYVPRDGKKELTDDWDAGAFEIRALTFQSDVATGTAPFTVASTTVSANLNADLWDGYQFADYLNQAVRTTDTPTLDDLTITTPVNIYLLSHDSFADFLANEHIDWTSTASNLSTSGSGTFADLHSIDQMDFDAALEDKLSLYADRLGAVDMYGFGVASGVLYYKTPTDHKFYVGANYSAAGYKLVVSATQVLTKVNLRVYGADLTVDNGTNLGTATGAGTGDLKMSGDVIHVPNLKSGINQGAAGAGAGELWADTGDANTVKLGV